MIHNTTRYIYKTSAFATPTRHAFATSFATHGTLQPLTVELCRHFVPKCCHNSSSPVGRPIVHPCVRRAACRRRTPKRRPVVTVSAGSHSPGMLLANTHTRFECCIVCPFVCVLTILRWLAGAWTTCQSQARLQAIVPLQFLTKGASQGKTCHARHVRTPSPRHLKK